MFRVAEVAKVLNVSSATVYALAASGRLKCHRIGTGRGCIRVSQEQLAAFLAGAEATPPPLAAPVQQVKLRHIRLS